MRISCTRVLYRYGETGESVLKHISPNVELRFVMYYNVNVTNKETHITSVRDKR